MDAIQGYDSDESGSEEAEVVKRHSTDAKVGKAKTPVAKTSKLGAEYLFGLGPKKPLPEVSVTTTSDADQNDMLERIRQKPRMPVVETSDASEPEETEAHDNTDGHTVEFSVDSFYQENNALIDRGDLDSARLEKENKKLRYYGVGQNQLSDVFKFNDKRKDNDDK